MGEIQTTENQLATVRGLLVKMADQFTMAAPRHLTADRIMRLAVNQLQRNPALLECDTKTLLGALMTAAQLGLEPDDVSGRAYLVPYKGKVTLIPGYRGLMELARRSGEIRKIEARVVRDGDSFSFAFGTTPGIQHSPLLDNDKAVTHAYAVAWFPGGEFQFDVMSRSEIDKIRKRSPAAAKPGTPWHTDFEEMAKKTVVRRLSKYLPSSPELQRAITIDEQAEAGRPQDLEIVNVGDEPAKPKSLDDTIDADEPDAAGPVEWCGLPMADTIKKAWKTLTPDQRRELSARHGGTDLGIHALKPDGFRDWTASEAEALLADINAVQAAPKRNGNSGPNKKD